MAANTKNKYPADKAGSKYAEFRNTKRFSESKVKEAAKQNAAGGGTGSAKTSTA